MTFTVDRNGKHYLSLVSDYLLFCVYNISVFVDTRLWETKHPRKRFQNFRQSCVITHKTDKNFGSVSAGVLFSKVAYH